MRRSDWLIVFLAAEPGGPLDPVRVQKGMFLLAMSGLLEQGQRYRFEPYAYGPMSRNLYGDVHCLAADRLLDAVPIESATWRLLALTPAGTQRADTLRRRAEHERRDALVQLDTIRSHISGLTFSQLLEYVYDRYPEYAVRSVFRRSR